MTNHVVSLIRSDRAATWQEILSDLITDPQELLRILELNPDTNPYSLEALDKFPLKAPRPFVERIEKGNWHDPLLRQIWPSVFEETQTEGFVADPLNEEAFNPLPGLLHKYHGRVLLTAAPHCAIHCRYCFRRHFDYQANSPSRTQWEEAFAYIAADSSIEEVILSGGDPLAISDRQFNWLLQQLASIKQLTTVRIHTRLPIVIPQRITTELVRCLAESRLRLVMVVHCNHAQELDNAVIRGFRDLSDVGVTMLNQSVILKDVNDNADALIDLNKALFQHNVLPYYLHMPDQVAGTEHFYVTDQHATELIKTLHASLPGYLVPRLVRENPGEPGKTRIA
ncbi:MAG: EF-P beta-lysylation protein EpmB [Gammaproteobacteria bacterium]|nr:EF-P beta-lysylation protein EpmB [Gammaproteobacteria bacterium]